MTATLKQTVVFIGFMGAGKTSVSQYLASTLGLPLVDIDSAIEQEQGRSIACIFADDGEDVFRALEAAKLAELLESVPQLVSCGGGIVERDENRALLQQKGLVVFLEVDVQEASRRVGNDTARPLFTDRASVGALLERRNSFYKEVADLCINTTERSVREVASEIQDYLLAHNILFA